MSARLARLLPKGGGRMAKERLVVIGGNGAGMSAAANARRRRGDLEIVAIERGPYTSFAG